MTVEVTKAGPNGSDSKKAMEFVTKSEHPSAMELQREFPGPGDIERGHCYTE